MKKLRIMLASIGIGALVGAGLMQTAIARADDRVDVCAYLDTRPTVAGVEDLMTIGLFSGIDGRKATPEQVATFVFTEVRDGCPRHLFELKAFAEKWASKTRKV